MPAFVNLAVCTYSEFKTVKQSPKSDVSKTAPIQTNEFSPSPMKDSTLYFPDRFTLGFSEGGISDFTTCFDVDSIPKKLGDFYRNFRVKKLRGGLGSLISQKCVFFFKKIVVRLSVYT